MVLLPASLPTSLPALSSLSSSLFVQCHQLRCPLQSLSLLPLLLLTLSSIAIATVVVVVVVIHCAVAIKVIIVVVVVHRAIVAIVVFVVAVHCAAAIFVVNVVSTVTRTQNSPPSSSPSSSPPPCDSPSSSSNCQVLPPPLPQSDEDGEVIGGPRLLVVIASPEVDDGDNDLISLWASCAIAHLRRMILFITARLPTLPLPFRCRHDRRRRGARFLRTCPRDRRSGSAHNDTITAMATQGQRMCVLIFLFLLSVGDVLQH